MLLLTIRLSLNNWVWSDHYICLFYLHWVMFEMFFLVTVFCNSINFLFLVVLAVNLVMFQLLSTIFTRDVRNGFFEPRFGLCSVLEKCGFSAASVLLKTTVRLAFISDILKNSDLGKWNVTHMVLCHAGMWFCLQMHYDVQ
jgi:hypothetical protein